MPRKNKIPNAALKVDVQAWQLVLLALLNAILLLCEYPIAWRYVLLAPLLKHGKGKSKKSLGDHRPTGPISTVTKLLKQILLSRLTPLLLPVLSPDQAGGWLGADAALYVWELLLLREGGRCPDARHGRADTWLAFLDIESFFDRVWTHGLLYQL